MVFQCSVSLKLSFCVGCSGIPFLFLVDFPFSLPFMNNFFPFSLPFMNNFNLVWPHNLKYS